LDHQNNYIESLSNATKNFDVLTINLNVLRNYLFDKIIFRPITN